jgi:hypothetical protein
MLNHPCLLQHPYEIHKYNFSATTSVLTKKHVVHTLTLVILNVNSETVRPRLGSSDFNGIYYTIYRRIQLQLTALNNMKAEKQWIRNHVQEVVAAWFKVHICLEEPSTWHVETGFPRLYYIWSWNLYELNNLGIHFRQG